MGVIKILFHTIRPHGLAIMNRSGYLLHLSSLILIITIFPVATKLRGETGATWPNLMDRSNRNVQMEYAIAVQRKYTLGIGRCKAASLLSSALDPPRNNHRPALLIRISWIVECYKRFEALPVFSDQVIAA
jgi:hypothetical protein